MNDLKQGLARLWARSPMMAIAIVACGVLFFVEQAMNAINGYRRAGGDWQLVAFGYAAIMLAIGVVAAWCPWAALGARKFKAAGLWALCVPMFLICQANGWAVMGVTLADGQVKRGTQATSREVIEQRLEQKRAELKSIGVMRPIGRIDADLDLELRRTSKTFPNGDGPKATALKGERATVVRAAELEKEIDGLVKTIAHAPQVAGGAVDTAVIIAVWDGVREWRRGEPLAEAERTTASNVTLGFSIALVAVIGFFATFGPALILGRQPTPDVPPDDFLGEGFLPAQYRQKAIETTPDHPPHQGHFPGPPVEPPSLHPAPTPLMPVVTHPAHGGHHAGGQGGGATNHIYVNGATPLQRLPPRAAARRNLGR